MIDHMPLFGHEELSPRHVHLARLVAEDAIARRVQEDGLAFERWSEVRCFVRDGVSEPDFHEEPGSRWAIIRATARLSGKDYHHLTKRRLN